MEIEQTFTELLSIEETLWKTPRLRKVKMKENPFLTTAISILDKWFEKLHRNISPLTTFTNQERFIPVKDTEYMTWKINKQNHLKDITNKSTLLDELQLEYNMKSKIT